MSQNLYWRPKYNNGRSLSDNLKYILRVNERSNSTFMHIDIPYLQGLADAGIKDAHKLIKAIERHEYVEVYEE